VTAARRRRRVAVVFGGRSAEHEISVVSAGSVLRALDPERYDVLTIGIDKEGRWHRLDALPAARSPGALPAVDDAGGRSVALSRDRGQSALVDDAGGREPIDVVFPLLHGPFGEDGTIQGMLELAGVPYVGSGVLGSAVGMDKAVQKVLFRDGGLEVVPFVVVQETEWERRPDDVVTHAAALGSPVFVKPAALGSSVGITKVKQPDDLPAALAGAFAYGRKALIERAMEGAREIELAVLGNDDPEVSVAGEIVPAHEFYDYEAKYLDEHGAALVVPAEVDDATLKELQEMAVTAFRAVGAAGMARVDFFLMPDGRAYVNEINTIPGFTKISMFPRLWETSGVSYAQLVDRLVELALERHEKERKRGHTLPG
jgi:D-alanine-D-alanine ligase